MPHTRACRSRPMLQVPWLWPWVPGLQQPRQEEFLLEMRCRGSHGQELQGNAAVPDVSRQGRKRCRPCLWWRLLPGLPGRASEVERQEVKFLQLNLGRGKDAQDLLMQTAREREADVLPISEQYKWSENSSWFQDASRRSGILVCSPDLSVGDFLESDAGFVWVEVAGVRVYSCYFSPNDPFEVFETQILLFEESFSEAIGRSLIGGDFNS